MSFQCPPNLYQIISSITSNSSTFTKQSLAYQLYASLISSLNFNYTLTNFYNLKMYEPLSAVQNEQVKMKRNIIYTSCQFPIAKPIQTMATQLNSSLFLQQLIYYNTFYSIIFIYLFFASQIWRLIYLQPEDIVPVRLVLIIIFILIQYFRLSNGFFGNLKESFPQIFGFFILTIFTLVDQLLCLILKWYTPMQFSLLLFGIIMHGLQLIVCVFTMGRLTQAQTALFYWKNSKSQTDKKK